MNISGYDLLLLRTPDLKVLEPLAVPKVDLELSTLQEESLTGKSGTSLPPPTPQTRVTLGKEVDLIRELNDTADQPARPLRPPVIGLFVDAAISTTQLATQLQQAVEDSGLFYESHLAQWVAGDRPLNQMLSEAVQRWRAQPGEPPPMPLQTGETSDRFAQSTYDQALGEKLNAARIALLSNGGNAAGAGNPLQPFPLPIAPGPAAALTTREIPGKPDAPPASAQASPQGEPISNDALAAYHRVAATVGRATPKPDFAAPSPAVQADSATAKSEALPTPGAPTLPITPRDEVLNQQLHFLRSGEMTMQIPSTQDRRELLRLRDEGGPANFQEEISAKAMLELDLPYLGKITISLQITGNGLGVQVAPDQEKKVGRADMAELVSRLGQIPGLRLEQALLKHVSTT